MRTSQVLPRGQQFYGGTALYFALFCDVAGRDEQTIEAFWASIARFWGAWYRRQDYYQQINQLRGVMGKAPANGLSEAHAVGVYSRVAVFQDESGQKGHSQVLLTLRTENTQALPAGEFDQFELPFCNGHILVPDPGYGAPLFSQQCTRPGVLLPGRNLLHALLHCGGRPARGYPDTDGSGGSARQ